MLAQPQVLWLPKAGNTPDEYEDAYEWDASDFDPRSEALTCAIADGATAASFSRIWAWILVRAFCEERIAPDVLEKSMPVIQQQWLQQVSSSPLAWYAEQKLHEGAFATLLGIAAERDTLHEPKGGRWTALAVGDSCLVQVREDRLLVAFPLTRADQFNTSPHLVSSNPQYNARLRADMMIHSGNWRARDEFYLMTDAIACWFLQALERQQKPWAALRALFMQATTDHFARWLAEQRDTGRMRNDDVTVVRVRMP